MADRPAAILQVSPMPSATNHRSLPQLAWELDSLTCSRSVADARAARRTFPIRLLRYWFAGHLLKAERRRAQRPLSVCEVGIDAGQMKFYMNLARTPADSEIFSSWVGVDCRIKPDPLASLGYTKLIDADIARSNNWQTPDHDAIILLHVLEHLSEPEAAVTAMARKMKPGSVLIGGFPSVPNWSVRWRESYIRRHPTANGHASVFSPARVKAMARTAGLQVDFLAGAFFLRAAGFLLEDFSWWLRFNLLFGGLFPAWPGEIYWLMRKPSGGDTATATNH